MPQERIQERIVEDTDVRVWVWLLEDSRAPTDGGHDGNRACLTRSQHDHNETTEKT